MLQRAQTIILLCVLTVAATLLRTIYQGSDNGGHTHNPLPPARETLPRLRRDQGNVVSEFPDLPVDYGRQPDPDPTHHYDFATYYLRGQSDWMTVSNLSTRDLDANQYRSDCSTRNLVVASLPPQGLTYSFLWLQDAMAYALLNNRTLIINNWRRLWQYADKEACGSQTWECLFLKESNCELPADYVKTYKCWDDPAADDTRIVAVGRARGTHRCGFFVPHIIRNVKHRVYKLNFPSRVVFTDWLFKPQRKLMNYIIQVQKFLGLQERTYLSMHVRYGDKALEVGPKAIEAYLKALTFMSDRAAAIAPNTVFHNKVFVATDSRDIAEQLKRMNISKRKDKSRFKFFLNLKEEHMEGGEWSNGRFKSGVDVENHAFNFLTDLWLMSKAWGFVGTQSSNVGTAVINLLCSHYDTTMWVDCFAKALDGVDRSQTGSRELDGPNWDEPAGCVALAEEGEVDAQL